MSVPKMNVPFRQLRPPLSDEDFRPLEEWVTTVQFWDPLSDAEHKRVAKFLEEYPDVSLRAFGRPNGVETLKFLKHYPSVRHLEIDLYLLKSTDGIEHVTPELRSFSFSQTASKAHSLAFLKRFENLEQLSIEKHTKDIAVVSGLGNLKQFHLRSVTLHDLSLLTPLKKLKAFTLKLGGTTDLMALREIESLRYFEAWMVRGLSNLSILADMKALTHLYLQSLVLVKSLPSFTLLNSLRWVTIEALKQLPDLSPIAQAPNLEELLVLDMRHLRLPAIEPFVGHKKLRAAAFGLGSLRRNEEARHLLGVVDEVTDKFTAYQAALACD